MILGRDPNLFLGAVTAVLGALVALNVVVLTPDQVGAVTAAAGAIIAVVAGTVTNHAGIAAAGK